VSFSWTVTRLITSKILNLALCRCSRSSSSKDLDSSSGRNHFKAVPSLMHLVKGSKMSARDFAPYQPPPDERLTAQNASSSRGVASVPSVPRSTPIQDKASRVSIDSDLDPRYATESYQSSTPRTPQYSTPAFGEQKQSLQSAPVWQQQAFDPSSQRLNSQQGRPDHLSYSTAQGYNLSNLCFAAWAFPPFSSVLMLIIETENVSDWTKRNRSIYERYN
jgi:hypothetical protein